MIGWSTGVTPGGRWLRLPRLFPKARANTQLSEQLNLTVIADHLDEFDLFKLRLGMNAIGGHFRTHINSVSPLLPLRSYEAQAFARAGRDHDELTACSYHGLLDFGFLAALRDPPIQCPEVTLFQGFSRRTTHTEHGSDDPNGDRKY